MAEQRIERRRKEDEVKLPISSSDPPRFPAEQEKLFRDVLRLMNKKHIPYAVSGAFALHEHTGVWRQTKDLDLFIPVNEVQNALDIAEESGYAIEVKDPVWLAKILQDGHFVDLISGMSNAVIRVDQSWIDRAVPSEVLGVGTKVLAAEELIASKIFVTRRERFDGADVAHLIYATRDMLDWDRMFQLVGEHWEMLLWSLIFYRYVYPRHANEVPYKVWHELLQRFERDLIDPKIAAPFRGSLIDENMFAIDVKEWGLENEIERYRAEHAKAHAKPADPAA
jgi:hypothetical protein